MDVFFGAGIALFILALTLPIGLVVLAVVVVFSGRGEADPGDRRVATLYLSAVSFVAAFTLVFALYGVASSLLRLPLETESFGSTFTEVGPGFEEEEFSDVVEGGENDDEWRAAVLSGLVALTAGGLLAFHLPRLRRETNATEFAESSARRVFAGYLYTTCFFAAVILLVAVTAAAYSAFASVAPGVASASGEGQRTDGVVSLVSLLVLVTGLGTLFAFHFREGTRWRGGEPRMTPPPPPSPPPPAAHVPQPWA